MQQLFFGNELIFDKFLEQLLFVNSSVLMALVLAVSMTLLIYQYPFLKSWCFSILGLTQTIPGLALLVILVPFLGIGKAPAIATLTLYSLYPIVATFFTGLMEIPREQKEAGISLGMTFFQRIFFIEIPLGLAALINGIRLSYVSCIGLGTLAAFIGAGGLGDFINQGLALNRSDYLFSGAIPSILWAIAADYFFRRLLNLKRWRLRGVLIFLFIPLLFSFAYLHKSSSKNETIIHIGCANFTEQYILGEILAQLIEGEHIEGVQIKRSFNLGTDEILFEALKENKIDIYPTYTGSVFLQHIRNDYQGEAKEEIYDLVSHYFQEKWHLSISRPLGFNNTQALSVKENFAKMNNLKNLSDLKRLNSKLILGAPPEFISRPDGYIGIKKAYGFNPKQISYLAPSLTFEAIKNDQVNIIMAFSTDGNLEKYKLRVLEDDRRIFPPYDSVYVFSADLEKRFPQLKKVMEKIEEKISDEVMKKLNYQVDVLGKTPEKTVEEFLINFFQ